VRKVGQVRSGGEIGKIIWETRKNYERNFKRKRQGNERKWGYAHGGRWEKWGKRGKLKDSKCGKLEKGRRRGKDTLGLYEYGNNVIVEEIREMEKISWGKR
jgi:hypothetical protein